MKKLKKENLTAVILCGGKGTRFNLGKKKELKPLVKINGKSILFVSP